MRSFAAALFGMIKKFAPRDDRRRRAGGVEIFVNTIREHNSYKQDPCDFGKKTPRNGRGV